MAAKSEIVLDLSQTKARIINYADMKPPRLVYFLKGEHLCFGESIFEVQETVYVKKYMRKKRVRVKVEGLGGKSC